MVNVLFNSRGTAKRFFKTEAAKSFLIISVNTTKEDMDEMMDLACENDLTATFLVFSDDEESFTTDQAHEIIDMVREMVEDSSINDVFVHCDAGISRSGAIAKFINDYFGNPDHPMYLSYTVYNRMVYRKLEEAHFQQYGVNRS